MGSYRFPIVKDELNKIDILVQFFMASRLQLSYCIFYIPHKKQTCQENSFCYLRKSSATATRRTAARCVSFYGYRRTQRRLSNALRASTSFLRALTEVYASEANQQGKRNRFSRHKLAARVIPIPLLRFARTAFLIIRHRRQAMPLRCPIQL